MPCVRESERGLHFIERIGISRAFDRIEHDAFSKRE